MAVLWDQSLVWGLICWETLRHCGVPFHLLNARDIGRGHLQHYRVLLVPGGWAAHKVRALGDMGKSQIERFVARGGSYLGFCGGAGLALSDQRALELVPLERLPRSQRLPSASGEVWIRGIPGHPAWQDLPRELPVSVWWPSQFAWQPLPRTVCLSSYVRPGKDFWVADLPVADLEAQNISWSAWEQDYGIKLNPGHLVGHPAMLEVRVGKGRVILSYPHLETPGDRWGNRLLLGILAYLDREAACHLPVDSPPSAPLSHFATAPGTDTREQLRELEGATRDLIRFGERHLLWKWHLPWLLRWQRGIRGLEYCFLAVTSRYLLQLSQEIGTGPTAGDPWLEPARQSADQVRSFCQTAKHLLLEEKLAAQTGSLSKLGSVSPSVDRLRRFLFGNQMNHGGLCRTLFDQIDQLLLHLLRYHHNCSTHSKKPG